MLIPIMDSRLMVHAELIAEQNLKHVGRELKMTKAEDGISSKVRFEVKISQCSRIGSQTKVLLTL